MIRPCKFNQNVKKEISHSCVWDVAYATYLSHHALGETENFVVEMAYEIWFARKYGE